MNLIIKIILWRMVLSFNCSINFEKNIVIGHLPLVAGNELTNSLIYDTNITIDFKMESLSENLIAIEER